MRNHYLFCLFNIGKEKQNIIMNIRDLFNNNNKNPFILLNPLTIEKFYKMEE